jgi:hypothetical protein
MNERSFNAPPFGLAKGWFFVQERLERAIRPRSESGPPMSLMAFIIV